MSSPRLHSNRFRMCSLLRGEGGISLVELMAAMVISLMVVGAGFTALIASQKASRVNDLVAQTQQSVRIAMELIARDVKMAGFGMTAGTVGACAVGGNAAPIVPLDNNPAGADIGPDRVDIVVPNTNTTIFPLWTLRAQAPGAVNTQIDLQVGAVAAMQTAGLAVNDVISIGGAVSSAVTVIDAGNDRLTLQTPIGAPRVFPGGTQVYILQCVRYSIGTTTAVCAGNAPCLVRAGVPLVEGIEDLQLAYACDGCNLAVNGGVPDGIPDDQNGTGTFDTADFITNSNWTLAPLTPDKIRLVQINLVARQTREDQGFAGDQARGGRATSTLVPIIVSDHDPSNDAGFTLTAYQQERRRVLTRSVQTRNSGP